MTESNHGLGKAVNHLGQVGSVASQTLRRGVRRTAGLLLRGRKRAPAHPGAAPGMTAEQLHAMAPGDRPVTVTRLDYGPQSANARTVTDPADMHAARPEGTRVCWIDLDGVCDPVSLGELARTYDLHPLAMEDVVHTHQRPKVELYDTDDPRQLRLFVVTRMFMFVQGHLHSEQVSFFVGPDMVITIQESPGDVWDNVRQRIHTAGTRLRAQGAPFLLYALLDALIDALFPVLEHYSDQLEAIEDRVLLDPDAEVIHDIHAVKRELMLIRREVWPMREMLHQLQHVDLEYLDDTTRTYLRDVHDHAIQAMDLTETARELAGSLADTWMNAISTKMNEVMKVLTVIASLFIPATFLTGVFGMNFKHMPMLESPYGFYAFVGLCVVSMVGLLGWLRWRKWV